MIWRLIRCNFCENARGRDGHGHAYESKKDLSILLSLHWK